MEKSLKQIIYETNVLVNAHVQLRSFYYGDLLDIIKIGRIDYASCFLSINSASNNANFETFNLELFVFDILAADDSNRTDIENTTKRILNDLITTIRYSTRWNDFSEVLNDVSELKYYDKLQDRLSGWGCTIQLKVYSNDCLVGLPIDDYDFDMGGNFEATVLAIVKNTDNDILATKLVSDSDDTIIVPNITITDSDGTEIDYPSGVNFTCTAGGGSGDVEVNGVVYGQYTAPNDFNVLVYNRAVAGSLVGSLGTGRWVIGQSPIQVNTTPLDFVSAEATYNLNVLDQNSNPIGSASGTNWVVNIPTCDDATVTVNGNAFATVPSGDTLPIEVVNTELTQIGTAIDPFITIDDSEMSINGTVMNYTPATTSYNQLVLNQVGTQVGAPIGADWVVINPIRGNFQANRGVLDTFVVDASSAGVYTGTTNDGGSGTVTILVNGGAISFPQTLAIGDLIDVSRSTTTSIGWYQLNG
jgi:hypothetical protein